MTTATTIVVAYHSTSIYLWTPQSNFIHRNAQLLIFNFSTRPSKSQMRAIYLFIFFHSFEMTSLKLLIPSWFLIMWFYYLFFVCFRPFFPLFLFFIVSSCLARRDAKVTSTSYTRRGMQISLHQLFCLFFSSLSLSLSFDFARFTKTSAWFKLFQGRWLAPLGSVKLLFFYFSLLGHKCGFVCY